MKIMLQLLAVLVVAGGMNQVYAAGITDEVGAPLVVNKYYIILSFGKAFFPNALPD